MVLAPIFGNTTSTTASSTLPSPLDPPDQRSLRMGRDTPSPEVLNPKKKGAVFMCRILHHSFSPRGGLLILHERELRSKTVLSQIGSIDTIAQQSRPLYLVLFRTPSILVKKNWPLHLCEVDYGARSVPGVPGVPALVRCPVVTVNNFVQVPWGPWMSMGNFCIFQAQSHRTMDTMS